MTLTLMRINTCPLTTPSTPPNDIIYITFSVSQKLYYQHVCLMMMIRKCTIKRIFAASHYFYLNDTFTHSKLICAIQSKLNENYIYTLKKKCSIQWRKQITLFNWIKPLAKMYRNRSRVNGLEYTTSFCRIMYTKEIVISLNRNFYPTIFLFI